MPRRPGDSYEPGRAEITPLPNGGALVKLENGVERLYDQDELADYVVELVHTAHVSPELVDERWLETIRRAVGEERWHEATLVIAAIIGP